SELAQKTGKILFFPAPRAIVAAKLALASIEFLRVDASPATPQKFVRNNGVKHFVVEHVFQKPARHECLIEQGVNSNHAVLLLDCSKNEMIPRPMSPATPPFHFVISKPAAKIALVQLIKNLAEIEVLAFLTKI